MGCKSCSKSRMLKLVIHELISLPFCSRQNSNRFTAVSRPKIFLRESYKIRSTTVFSQDK